MDTVRSRANVVVKLVGREITVTFVTLILAARTVIVDVHGNVIASKSFHSFLSRMAIHSFCLVFHTIRPGYGGMLCDEGT